MSTTIAATPSGRAFISDNMAGASPQIARAVADAATGQVLPYGNDPYTERARRRLGEIFERDVDIFPVSTGSAANGLSLAALTPPWGSVLSHPDSHINHDECGAPEFFTGGSKLVDVAGPDTKVDPGPLKKAVRRRAGDVHSVQPSVLSISQATESGSVYTLDEIRALSAISKDAGLRVHMDGARFANALVHLGATPAEMTWKAGCRRPVVRRDEERRDDRRCDRLLRACCHRRARLPRQARPASSRRRCVSKRHRSMPTSPTACGWTTPARPTRWPPGSATASRPSPTPDSWPYRRPTSSSRRLPQRVTEALLAEGYAFYHDRWEPGTVRFVTAFSHSAEDIDQLLDAVQRHTR